jgi:hypothetical protein
VSRDHRVWRPEHQLGQWQVGESDDVEAYGRFVRLVGPIAGETMSRDTPGRSSGHQTAALSGEWTTGADRWAKSGPFGRSPTEHRGGRPPGARRFEN